MERDETWQRKTKQNIKTAESKMAGECRRVQVDESQDVPSLKKQQ